MERTLGSDIENPIARRQFLADNCDAVVDKGYMKPYSRKNYKDTKRALPTCQSKSPKSKRK